MPLTIPVSINYPSPLRALPSRSQDEPIEGRLQIPCEVLWGTMGGTTKAVTFNVTGNDVLRFSQISALKIDNRACGVDVTFIFPDTQETITIPAYSPLSITPVLSNSLTFYVSAPGALSADATRFQVLNYTPQIMDIAAANAMTSNSVLGSGSFPIANGTTAILPASVNGVITGANILVNWAKTTGQAFGQADIRSVGQSVPLISTAFASGLAADDPRAHNDLLYSQSGLSIRFVGGLEFKQSGIAAVPTLGFWQLGILYQPV